MSNLSRERNQNTSLDCDLPGVITFHEQGFKIYLYELTFVSLQFCTIQGSNKLLQI